MFGLCRSRADELKSHGADEDVTRCGIKVIKIGGQPNWRGQIQCIIYHVTMGLSHNYRLVIPLWMSTVFPHRLPVQIKIYSGFFIILTTPHYLQC